MGHLVSALAQTAYILDKTPFKHRTPGYKIGSSGFHHQLQSIINYSAIQSYRHTEAFLR